MATAKDTRKRNTAKSPAAQRPRRNTPPPSPAPSLTISDDELYERVARRAYQLYQQRGEEPGNDLADWLAAEQLVKAELLHGPVPEEPLEVED
jgi:hypothetical protein